MQSGVVKLSDLYEGETAIDRELSVDEIKKLASKGNTDDSQFLAGIKQMVVDQIICSTLEETVKVAKEKGYEVEVVELP